MAKGSECLIGNVAGQHGGEGSCVCVAAGQDDRHASAALARVFAQESRERDRSRRLGEIVGGAENQSHRYVSGGGTLVRGMLADKLVDELHLFLFPVALGAGKRLFAETSTTKLALAGSDAYDNGVVSILA